MSLHDEIIPATNGRAAEIVLSDLFAGEQLPHSGFGDGQTYRQAQLARIEADLSALRAAVAALAPGVVDLEAMAAAVCDEVARRLEA